MRPSETGVAFIRSVLAGAYAGITIQSAVVYALNPIPLQDLWILPVLIIVYGMISVPFVAAGLAVFGLPLTQPLRRYADHWWVAIIAALWGAVSGEIVYTFIDNVIFGANWQFGTISPQSLGPIYGVPTALAWWVFRRRGWRREEQLAEINSPSCKA